MTISFCRRIFAALFVLAVAACAAEGQKERGNEPVGVVAKTVRMLPEQLRLEAIGSARAVVSAELYPETAGEVSRVRFQAGDYVKQGQPLVELDARRERLAVRLAEVAVREAEQLLSRYRRIEDTGALSESQIEAGETALTSAQIELEQTRVALADRTIRAPFSGHMGITEIDRGDRISPTTAIAQIDNRSTLFIDFAAPEETFARLRTGTVVQVTPYSDPQLRIDARIQAVNSQISREERTFTVRALVDNPGDKLRPGMSFRVLYEADSDTRPAVPEEAIVWGGDGSYLWAIRSGKAVRVPLTIISRREGMVLIDARIKQDERIITRGVQKVRDGQNVNVVAAAKQSSVDATMGSARPEAKARVDGR